MAEPARGWSDRIHETFKGWANGFWDWVEEHFPMVYLAAQGRAWNFLVDDEEKVRNPLLDALRGIPALDPSIRQGLDLLVTLAEKTGFPVDGFLSLGIFNQLLEGYLSPYSILAAYTQSRELRTARPDPSTAWLMAFRNPAYEATLKDMLRDTGWTDGMIEQFWHITQRYPEVAENMTLLWRGELNDTTFKHRLGALGYQDAAQDDYLTLAKRIPGPGDLISMAVREAFHPELIEKYHYMDAFPPEFAEWMIKQGYDQHWAEKYWVAHWRLPSIQAGFTMLHRGEIDEGELRDLLRTADIAPVWHDPLIQIAYAPYTRVDVRRMHKLGVVTDAELVKAYQDLGYDTEHAENMAWFTILYNAGADREGTKADILKGYKTGIFDETTAKGMLVDLGYTDYWADYYLAIEDLRLKEELVDEELTTIKALYTTREISESDARVRLSALNLSSARIEKLIQLWRVARERTIARPSVGDLETFFRDGLIGSAEFKIQLGKRGYVEPYIEWYHTSLLLDMQRKAVAEEARAAKEAERIEAAVEKTRYQEEKARIDAEIAQVRLHQINLRVELEQAMTSAQRRSLMDTIEASKLRITEIQADIATKRTHLTRLRSQLRTLELSPELVSLYDRRDETRLQIATTEATIADLQSLLVETRGAIGRAAVSGEVEELRRQIDTLQIELSQTREQRAALRVAIAEIEAEIARVNTEIGETQVRLRQLIVSPEIMSLYEIKDTTSVQIGDLRSDIADLRADIIETDTWIRRERISPEVTSQRNRIDETQESIAIEQEEIAHQKLAIAQAQAALAGELTSEQVAILEEALRQTQIRIRELEAERARLRL